MACKEWTDRWVAKLYDELTPEETEGLETHLERCAECRSTLEQLEGSRQVLRAAAPSVPSSPRILFVRTGSRPRAAWHYVYGVAAALLVFVLGAWIGVRQLAPPAADPAALESMLAADVAERRALETRIGELETSLAKIDVQETQAIPGATEASISREEYEIGLEDLQRQRMRDLEFLLGEMNAVELRAARWVDETREGLQMVAMQSNLTQR